MKPNRDPLRASSRRTRVLPSVYMWKRRTTWPCSTNRSARPIMSNTSRVRAWMPRARVCRDRPVALVDDAGPDAAGQQLAGQPSPVGPAPTTRTWQSLVMTAAWILAPAGTSEKLPRSYVSSAPARTRRPTPPAACGAEPELGQDVVDVRVDGTDRQVSCAAIPRLVKTPRDQGRHLELAPGERPARPARQRPRLVRQRVGNRFGQAHLPSLGHDLHGHRAELVPGRRQPPLQLRLHRPAAELAGLAEPCATPASRRARRGCRCGPRPRRSRS